MQIRHPRFSRPDLKQIDCEIEHPKLGWIPFTTTPDDVEETGRQVFDACIDGAAGAVAPYVQPVVCAAQNKAYAENALLQTDWVNQPDVYDPANTPHLTNRDAFIVYRSQVRAIAINPVEGNLDWPTAPSAVWSV